VLVSWKVYHKFSYVVVESLMGDHECDSTKENEWRVFLLKRNCDGRATIYIMKETY